MKSVKWGGGGILGIEGVGLNDTWEYHVSGILLLFPIDLAVGREQLF